MSDVPSTSSGAGRGEVFRMEHRRASTLPVWTLVTLACALIGGTGTAFWILVGAPRLAAWRLERAADATRALVKHQAEVLIRESLDAPSTARFVETSILEEESQTPPFGRYLIMSKVDAQNAMGVYLRGQFCAVLYSEGTKVFWKKEYVLVDCKKDWDPFHIGVFKRINGWEKPLPDVDASAP